MNQPAIAFAAAPLAGAVLGFLRYNFNPASIFLGDSGSLFLGFQLAVLSIVGLAEELDGRRGGRSHLRARAAAHRDRHVDRAAVRQRAFDHAARFRRTFITSSSAWGARPVARRASCYLGSGAFGLASLFVIHSGSPNIGLIALSFFALTVVAIQRLGYSEFAEINGALKRFVTSGRSSRTASSAGKLAERSRRTRHRWLKRGRC